MDVVKSTLETRLHPCSLMREITRSQPPAWSVATTGGPVRIDADAAKNLRVRVMEAFISLPKRGLEIGGVLYGHTQPDATRIEAFEEAPCEHRYGPSYSLSPVDRAQLNELLAANRTPHEDLSIVGFFRSFVSREPLIERADEEFVRSHFPSGPFLFLMLQPLSVEHCSASIRLFRDGELVNEEEAPAFAFNPPATRSVEPHVPSPPPPEPMPAPEPDLPEPPEEPAATAAPFDAPRLPPPYRHQEEIRNAPATKWWLVLALSLIFGVLGAVAFELWQLAREPRWTPLRLDAKTADFGLLVTWDPAGAAKGNTAVLLIDDGGVRREVNLTPQQIRTGSLQYAPAHTDVAFRLILYAKGLGVSGDAVRIASVVERIQPGPTAPPPSNPTPPPAARARAAVPAAPVHEVQPVVSEGIRSRIQGQIVIPVNVQVDGEGRVAHAAAAKTRLDGLGRYLAELAEKAAREWRFTPAKSPEGVAVASSKTLTFVFTP